MKRKNKQKNEEKKKIEKDEELNFLKKKGRI